MTAPVHHGVAAALAAALTVGCGGDAPTRADAAADVSLDGPCARDRRLGSFEVALRLDVSTVTGEVRDGVIPVTILEETRAEGDCTLLRRNNPFCDPACTPGETCDFDGTCIPFPERQDVGVVSITGLSTAVELSPLEPGNDYFTQIEHPGFAPGDLIELTSTDGHYGRLRMHGYGSAPIAPAGDMWTMAEASALSIAWDAPASPSESRVVVRIQIDEHGTTPVALHCDFVDTGAAEIPSTMIDELIGTAVSGYPSATIARRTADSMDVDDGCVEFIASTPRTHPLRVIGYTPCENDTHCPEGQTCDVPNQTCRD